MTKEDFRARAVAARFLGGDYGIGYRRGLRRHYHGEKFGTDEEHAFWYSMGMHGDPREEMGRGYRDGLENNSPDPNQPGRPATISAGRRVNVWLDQASVDRAEEIGGGNVSAGIRLALTKCAQKT